jgi:tetratricopeptide (TPR) repeat protein
MIPRAFVVSPFGNKEVRPASSGEPAMEIDFDDVYRFLVEPALIGARCEAFRADRESGAGDIRTDMFFELVTADVVLADISILNANVFYELGVRHGLADRGVLMIHGGWSKRPFDVAPDRTFDYQGALFEPGSARDESWQKRIEEAVAKLSSQIEAALAVDHRTIGSPVYKEVAGLKPADWSGIQTARAKYFRGVLDDWRRRVRIARKNGHPGDILTLADDAPTRYHRKTLLWEGVRALIDLHRFELAREILEDLLALDDKDYRALCSLGLILGRLGQPAEAEELLDRVACENPGNPNARANLGRVYKDMWRSRWEGIDDPAARRKAALDHSACASKAIRNYADAHRRSLNSYDSGINAITLATLLAHAEKVMAEPAVERIDDLDDFRAAVRLAAAHALSESLSVSSCSNVDNGIWAAATLGELELLAGNCEAARRFYQEASTTPGVTAFQIESMLGQAKLIDRLSAFPDASAAVVALLEGKLSEVHSRRRSSRNVVVFSGHFVDKPGRLSPRFPAKTEAAVGRRIATELEEWGIGEGDLAICGGDVQFAEICVDRRIPVRMHLPFSERDFVARSIRPLGAAWERRFYELLPRCEVAFQPARLGEPPEHASAFERNNVWIVNTARSEIHRGHQYCLLVWDEGAGGDGPGGAAHFADLSQQLSGPRAIINPTLLAPED